MYCCDKFELGCKESKRITPNFRIVKFTTDLFLKNNKGVFITRKGIDSKFVKGSNSSYRYFIGYTIGPFVFGSPLFNMINFCPYCGANLYQFYDKVEYANEIEGNSFNL